MLSDTELRPSGLVGNTDAERTIGARAMESDEKDIFGWPATSCGGDAGELSERSVAS
ncbi:E3 ubiquitin-protein ligase SspH2 [Salmonella enterica subsp. enterica serovar Heidelberg str. RI-11-014316]|nr:E3 ubiquitin-protein ligase SspH2 [Salmonella enterica subsp. enterica serovar Heidelberg str. RI-11-014316]